MKFLIHFALLFTAITLSSQTLTYKVLRENTDVKFIHAKISPADVLVSTSRMAFSASPGIKAYAKGLYFTANYDFQYIDNMASYITNVKGSSVYKSTKSRYANTTLGYSFSKIKQGKVYIRLGSGSTNGGMTKIEKYTYVDAKYKQQFGVQGGYQKGFSHLTVPSGISVTDYYDESAKVVQTQYKTSTFMEYAWLSFGGSYSKMIDVEVDLSTYGVRSNESLTRFYGNILLSTQSSLEDIYMVSDFGSSSSYTHRYVLNGNTNLSRLGFNIGYEVFKIKSIGLFYNLEIGLMPGVKIEGAGNGYLSFKWGMLIGKKSK